MPPDLNLTQAYALYDWLDDVERLRDELHKCIAQLNELSNKVEIFERWIESSPLEDIDEAFED